MSDQPTPRKKLILHIEVDGIWADDLDEMASIWADGEPLTPRDYLNVVTEDWMVPEVGLTIVTHPSEKSNDPYGVHAYTARIVGAETKDRS